MQKVVQYLKPRVRLNDREKFWCLGLIGLRRALFEANERLYTKKQHTRTTFKVRNQSLETLAVGGYRLHRSSGGNSGIGSLTGIKSDFGVDRIGYC